MAHWNLILSSLMPPRKLLDSKKIMQLGWQAEVELEKGLARTYQSFTEGKQN